MDVPGAEVDPDGNLLTWAEAGDGRKLKCAIQECSAGIRDWRDGQGRMWPDSLIHVALCALPVVSDQDGFSVALSTN